MNTKSELDNAIRLADHFADRSLQLAESALIKGEVDTVSSLVTAKKVKELLVTIKKLIDTR